MHTPSSSVTTLGIILTPDSFNSLPSNMTSIFISTLQNLSSFSTFSSFASLINKITPSIGLKIVMVCSDGNSSISNSLPTSSSFHFYQPFHNATSYIYIYISVIVEHGRIHPFTEDNAFTSHQLFIILIILSFFLSFKLMTFLAISLALSL